MLVFLFAAQCAEWVKAVTCVPMPTAYCHSNVSNEATVMCATVK
jgi:hypothetical protein